MLRRRSRIIKASQQLPAMEPLTIAIAEGIYRVYANAKERSRYPEHLPLPVLVLFQKFKQAYERKQLQALDDALSDNFVSDLYGPTKADFLKLMEFNFQKLRYGLKPYLTIEVFNITTASDVAFSAVIEMKASLQFVGIVTPLQWDAGKVFCEAQPEGPHQYWRITKLMKFNS